MHPSRPSRLLTRAVRGAALQLQHHARHFVAKGDLPPWDTSPSGAVGSGGFGFLDARGRGVRSCRVGFAVAFEALHQRWLVSIGAIGSRCGGCGGGGNGLAVGVVGTGEDAHVGWCVGCFEVEMCLGVG